ncbi:GATA transcription factor 2-like [Syzygium oleosum]|uniref:GATA transcription factor 2-like n=1 Tax=Syzygium oleosum TaxID=219896 RepID=UPI0024BA213D|nr:GATA transcription factor 2-like [Syzygium oleosum]
MDLHPASSSAAHHRLCADSSSPASSSSSPPPPSSTAAFPPFCTDFAHELCVPSDYAAELEWLSRFVDDSFADVPASEFPGAPTSLLPDAAFSDGRPRSKRSRSPGAPAAAPGRIRSPTGEGAGPGEAGEGGGGGGGAGRRCAHCASEKTPQWRTGPLGPKTLCNACGVRYKSGRLVPEYRPAASPTFVLTQHSNSHRKVMELRRQKEARQAAQPQQHHPQGGGGGGGQAHRHPRDFEAC